MSSFPALIFHWLMIKSPASLGLKLLGQYKTLQGFALVDKLILSDCIHQHKNIMVLTWHQVHRRSPALQITNTTVNQAHLSSIQDNLFAPLASTTPNQDHGLILYWHNKATSALHLCEFTPTAGNYKSVSEMWHHRMPISAVSSHTRMLGSCWIICQWH